MPEVKIKFKLKEGARIAEMLRKRYNRDKRTPLSTLCELAVRREAAAQARIENTR